jgi:hypothetical protein
MAVWFIYFIFFLGSGNGFIGLLTILVFGVFYLLLRYPNRKIKFGIILVFLVYSSYIIYLSIVSYRSHFVLKDDPYNSMPQSKSKLYYSKPNDQQLENGFLIWRNIANKQLKEQWEEISDPEFHDNDIKGQAIRGTLIRYLTSKALTKDSIGIHSLTDQDIKNIQNGDYHFEQADWNNLHLRIDQFFYQLMSYYYKNNPSGKPFLQRIFYWKGAVSIISENPILGVGGDIQNEFNSYFKSEANNLGDQYWRHSHNQYLTYFVVGGLIGFIAFLWAVFYPLWIYRKENIILVLAQLVLLISFISEDTLETQPGVTMYVLFLAFGITLLNGKGSNKVDVFDH